MTRRSSSACDMTSSVGTTLGWEMRAARHASSTNITQRGQGPSRDCGCRRLMATERAKPAAPCKAPGTHGRHTPEANLVIKNVTSHGRWCAAAASSVLRIMGWAGTSTGAGASPFGDEAHAPHGAAPFQPSTSSSRAPKSSPSPKAPATTLSRSGRCKLPRRLPHVVRRTARSSATCSSSEQAPEQRSGRQEPAVSSAESPSAFASQAILRRPTPSSSVGPSRARSSNMPRISPVPRGPPAPADPPATSTTPSSSSVGIVCGRHVVTESPSVAEAVIEPPGHSVIDDPHQNIEGGCSACPSEKSSEAHAKLRLARYVVHDLPAAASFACGVAGRRASVLRGRGRRSPARRDEKAQSTGPRRKPEETSTPEVGGRVVAGVGAGAPLSSSERTCDSLPVIVKPSGWSRSIRARERLSASTCRPSSSRSWRISSRTFPRSMSMSVFAGCERTSPKRPQASPSDSGGNVSEKMP